MSMKIKLIALCIAIIFCFTCCACGRMPSDNNDLREFVDSSNEVVMVPREINKVISMNNYCAQIMIGLGQGDKLIGITDEAIESPWLSVFFPQIDEVQIYDPGASVEMLIKANPDIVIVNEYDVAQEYRAKGLNAVYLSFYSFDEFEEYISKLCNLLGGDAKQAGDEYLDYFKSNIKMVQESLENTVGEKESLYYINGVSNKGLTKTTGRGSTNSELAKFSYVTYATDSLIDSPVNKIDEEAIIGKNPDNIIIGGVYQHILRDELFNSDVWKDVNAVKNQNVFNVPMGISPWNRYGIEMAMMVPWTAAIVYPEYFEYDLIEETISFYKTFTGYELTEIQASYILAGLSPSGDKNIT